MLSPGRISLQLSTEVSELTNTGAFTLNGGSRPSTVERYHAGLTIPALNVRRAETTVELPSGGSFAIAGLMQHTTKQVIDGFPGVKDLPVLGALFRSRDFQNDETELVVMVTAYLVKPTAEAALATPTDGLYRADRSGNAAAGPPEYGLQEERKAIDAAGSRPGRLYRALGEHHARDLTKCYFAAFASPPF